MLVFFSFKNAPILKETFVGLGFGFAQNLAICLFLCVFSLVLTDFYSEESTFVEEASQCTRESRWHVVCLASCSMQKRSHTSETKGVLEPLAQDTMPSCLGKADSSERVMPRFGLCFQMPLRWILLSYQPVRFLYFTFFFWSKLPLHCQPSHCVVYLLLSLELTCCWHMLLAEPFEDALKIQSLGPVLSKAASMECISPVSPRAPDAKMLEELKAEPWYQGEMSRKEAEGLLKRDGDFLVRKSTTNPGSFVLTGMHNGQAKHLLLVDPEGTVSTGRSTACTGHPSSNSLP